jgi:hypothetical protein
VKATQQYPPRREAPVWLVATIAMLIICAVVGGVVWGIVAVVGALTDREPGPAQVDVSWQCTEFGDRLYWPTDASRRTFAVVPGGCRT